MKAKVSVLFVILGGFLASQTWDLLIIPTELISIVGGFLLGAGYYMFLLVNSGRVWGIKVKSSGKSNVKTLCGAIGLILGGYSLIITLLSVFAGLSRFYFVGIAIHLLGFFIALALGPIVAKIIAERTLAKDNSAMILGQLELFKDIDSNINDAVNFVVGFEGVALFSQTNYCYAVYLYENYQLGSLSTPEEVALVGTYFVQKYHEKYAFKVDVEVIPGEPGRTVVAVGTGGIGVAKIQGTADQRLFRSYIFTRKK